MVYCVQAELKFNNATRRNAMLNGIAAEIATRPQWQTKLLEAVFAKDGAFAVAVEVRFNSATDMNEVKEFVIANATGPNTPNAGSWLKIHECSHDSPTPALCIDTLRQDW